MLDPLYRPLASLPGEGETVTLGGTQVEVTTTDTAPEVIDAQWMDDREVTLTVTDDVHPDRFAQLLPEFAALAAGLADRPTTAALTLPSRDVVRSRIARSAGFLPASVLAVADLRREGAVTGGGYRRPVRDAVAGDVPLLAELWQEQADYEAAVGTLRTSPAIREAITRQAAAAVGGEATVLVAEIDGDPAGAVVAEVPAESEWAGRRLTVGPVSYLTMAATRAAARSQGAGAALVTELHGRHRDAGITASVLHYSAHNPLSVPFWSQRGYRPVLTIFAKPFPGPGRQG